MGYNVVDPAEVSPEPDRPCELRRIGVDAGLSKMAVNRYRADPGEQLPLAYHYHDEQEEAFYVVSGTLQVDTPDGDFEVPEGCLFTADPESPHRAYNPGDAGEPVTVVAVGAPAVSGDAHAYEP